MSSSVVLGGTATIGPTVANLALSGGVLAALARACSRRVLYQPEICTPFCTPFVAKHG